jgi:hypothetical protein
VDDCTGRRRAWRTACSDAAKARRWSACGTHMLTRTRGGTTHQLSSVKSNARCPRGSANPLSSDLDLDVHPGRQVQLHQRVDGLR